MLPLHPPGRLALSLLLPLALALGGCASDTVGKEEEFRTTLYLAVAIDRDDVIDSALQQEIRGSVDRLQEAFGAIQPEVRFQVELHREDRLVDHLRRRNRSGLGPDLLLVPGEQAAEMESLQLTRAVRFPESVTGQLEQTLLGRVKLGSGELTGLPLNLFPQLACFDRRRLSESPETLKALMAASALGVRIGLPMDPFNLAWTMGARGALGSITAIGRGEGTTPARRTRIRTWLLWLRNAGLQQSITFHPRQDRLLEELMEGRVDWITCRSNQLNRLRETLGEHLAVAALPDGSEAPASPISRMRVIAFGINSNPTQKRAAEALASFAVNPQMQRTAALSRLASLPVNRLVRIPGASSSVLKAMVTSQQQSIRAGELDPIVSPSQRIEKPLKRVLTAYLVGITDSEAATEGIITALRQERNP